MEIISKETVWEASSQMGERNDCSVKAISLATNTDYRIVHHAFKKEGRRKGSGTWWNQQQNVCARLGYKLVCVHNPFLPSPRMFNAKTIRTLENDLPPHGTFIVYTTGHMLCARDGKILDWSKGRKKHLKKVYVLERMTQSELTEYFKKFD